MYEVIIACLAGQISCISFCPALSPLDECLSKNTDIVTQVIVPNPPINTDYKFHYSNSDGKTWTIVIMHAGSSLGI